jgi:hypothetical protein
LKAWFSVVTLAGGGGVSTGAAGREEFAERIFGWWLQNVVSTNEAGVAINTLKEGLRTVIQIIN